jgi:hypothetical protein
VRTEGLSRQARDMGALRQLSALCRLNVNEWIFQGHCEAVQLKDKAANKQEVLNWLHIVQNLSSIFCIGKRAA